MSHVSGPGRPSHRAEKELVLGCLRAIATRTTDVAAQPESIGELDWQWIVESCSVHGLLGFVDSVLKEQDVTRHLDPDIQQSFQDGASRAFEACRLKREELQHVIQLLDAEHVAVIPLKGAALAHLVYADLPFREMSDCDILVQTTDLRRAFDTLCDAGFRREDIPLSRNRWHSEIIRQTLTPRGWIPLGRIPLERDDVDVDLHFTPRYRVGAEVVEVSVQAAWDRSRPCPALGRRVRVLSPRDQVSFLVLHMVELYSPRLVQLLDVAVTVNRYDLGEDALADDLYPGLSALGRSQLAVHYAACHQLSMSTGTPTIGQALCDVYERFFTRVAIPSARMPDDRAAASHVTGATVLRNVGSLRKQAAFVLGYLLPCRTYYEHHGIVAAYRAHWTALLTRVWELFVTRTRRAAS